MIDSFRLNCSSSTAAFVATICFALAALIGVVAVIVAYQENVK